LGRFVSRDPIGYEAEDFNLYRYVGNNPLIHTDPGGLVTVEECWAEYGECMDAADEEPWYLRRATKAYCLLQLDFCIAVSEEAVKCYVVGGACVAAGALVARDGPLPIGDACAAGIIGGVICKRRRNDFTATTGCLRRFYVNRATEPR